ncbi:MAG: DUF4157 domain-containing protein [Pseudomonadales bacterium]
MPQTAKVAQTVEPATPQTRVTDTVQENTSSLEHAQFQARMRGMNIPPNGSPSSINHVVQRIEAGGQHPHQKHEDFMYLQRTIGNQAVIQMLDRMKAAETADIHKTAAAGVQGTGSSLPHLNKIQQSFGQHDISGVQVFTGTKAATASKAIGAQAYTTGNKIAFSSSSPDLHTTAHEATHVLQQAAGVQLNGGVGKIGDSYERQADAVADKVVKGQSAEGLITHQTGVQNSSPLQRLDTEPNGGQGFARKDLDMYAQVEKLKENNRGIKTYNKKVKSIEKRQQSINEMTRNPIQRLVSVENTSWDDTKRIITGEGTVSEFTDGSSAVQTKNGWIDVTGYQARYEIVHTTNENKKYTIYNEKSDALQNSFTTPERGHVLGQQNGGDGTQTDNVFAQDGGTNNGPYKTFENKMRKDLNASNNADQVTFEAHLVGDSIRYGSIANQALESHEDII